MILQKIELENIRSSYGNQVKSLNSGLSLIELLSLTENVDMRLLNAIQCAEINNTLPYNTVEAYVNAGMDGHYQMMHIPGIGLGSLAKLDQIIAEREEDDQFKSDSIDEMQYLVENEELLNLPLDEFLVKQKTVSVRLFNAISESVINGNCPYDTVADYLRCDTRHLKLRNVKNLGRASAVEFESLVADFITSRSYLIQEKIGSSGFLDIGHISRDIFSVLSASEQDVIVERFLNNKTLDSTASLRGVTRERVRQIEAKAVRKLFTKYIDTLRKSAEAICTKLSELELFELSIENFAELFECDIREASLYLAYLKKLGLDKTSLEKYGNYVFASSKYLPKDSWMNTLQDGLQVQPLPLVIARVIQTITNVPGFYIREFIENKWGIQDINNPSATTPNYGTTKMCIEALRRAGGPLHISDVRARICSLFNIDIAEHTINATLGRLKECTITGIGKYVLYENLLYSATDIESIRNISYDHLKSKGVFLSSKILFDEVFAPTSEKYPVDFNHYVVMGLVKDDERFTTKRGNMIGLRSFDLAETYISLQDEIHRIVMEHGPITLPEITERLSATRRLNNDSGIRLVLNQRPDLIRIGRRTYDALHRFFDTRQDYDDLLLAIRVSMLEKTKTTYAITQDLVRLGLAKVTPQLVESLLLSMDDILSQNGAHQLTRQDDDIVKYNEVVVQAIHNHEARKQTLEALRGKLSSERIEKLMSIDGRFINDIATTNSEPKETEIASILKEFEF